MKTARVDNIDVQIFENRSLLGQAAARAVAGAIRRLHTKQETVNMIFAAAPSQNEFLAAFIRESVDWVRINAFHMDEYLGLGADAPQSFGYYLQTHLFGNVDFGSVHLLNGLAADPQAECQRYATLLQTYPSDIVCMGIGEHNHLAFNEPSVADFHDPATVKD